MKVDKLLACEGIFRGETGNGFQYYQLVLKDNEGKTYLTTIAARLNYDESVSKAFTRLEMIALPEEKDELVKVELSKEEPVLV